VNVNIFYSTVTSPKPIIKRVVWFFYHRSSCTTHISEDIFTHKASDAAENLQLYWVVRFFHPRSSCTTHISADVRGITLNASSCITISGGRTEQLDIIAGFLPRHWLYGWFCQFHSCGTYSVLSRSPSIEKLNRYNHANFTASGIAIGCSTLQHHASWHENEHVNF